MTSLARFRGSADRPLGIRQRLLLTIASLVATAVLISTVAFNLILQRSIDNDASELARSRAAAALATIQVGNGKLQTAEALDDAAIDSRIWLYDKTHVLESPPASKELNAEVASLNGQSGRVLTKRNTRLAVVPIVDRVKGERLGTLVAGVSLAPYRQTVRTALIGSALFAALLFGVVLLASRWLLSHALRPVSRMTHTASDWSEHDSTQRFAQGAPHDELTELAATLDTLLERSAASVRRERRFSDEISHELRTPLARIRAEVELALSRERSTDAYRTALGAVDRSATQMARTVDTLVAAAREEASTTRGRCDARDAVMRALEAAERPGRTDRAILQLDLPETPVLVGVEVGVAERILTPLIENAWRYGSGGLTIALARTPTSVVLTLSDDGPGVRADEVESIFEPGARGSAAEGHAGTGLGLALSRRLARAVAGDVTALAAEHGRFVVTLPPA